jgi:hypothetical protein
MNYKQIVKYVGIPIVIIALIFAIHEVHVAYKTSDSYVNNPRNWIEDESVEQGVYVETLLATQGNSYYDGGLQQYDDGDIRTAFEIVGWYHGNFFNKYYYQNTTLKIHLGPNIVSDNDVMDFFAISKIVNGEPFVDVFVDDDFIKEYPQLNIYWGNETQFAAKLQFREIIPGIYYAQFKDDINRFQIIPGSLTQHYNGAYITDATYDQLFANQLEENIVIKIL